MSIILMTIAFIIIALIDFPQLKKLKKKYANYFIYIFLLLLGFAMSLMQIIDKAPISHRVLMEKLAEKYIYKK